MPTALTHPKSIAFYFILRPKSTSFTRALTLNFKQWIPLRIFIIKLIRDTPLWIIFQVNHHCQHLRNCDMSQTIKMSWALYSYSKSLKNATVITEHKPWIALFQKYPYPSHRLFYNVCSYFSLMILTIKSLSPLEWKEVFWSPTILFSCLSQKLNMVNIRISETRRAYL